jgi:hypothetical protein
LKLAGEMDKLFLAESFICFDDAVYLVADLCVKVCFLLEGDLEFISELGD